MARKERVIFTNHRQSKRGIMSFVLGVICVLSMIYGIVVSYKLSGAVRANFGTALFVTLVMSLVGLGLGINARMSGDKFPLLPNIGIGLNTAVILVLGFILWIGLR